MKRLIFLCSIAVATGLSAMKVSRVEPLSWWSDMKTPLTLMLYGEDLRDAEVQIREITPGVKPAQGRGGLWICGQRNADSPNYLFLDLQVARPGTYRITLVKQGQRKVSVDYVIRPRNQQPRQSFSSADVVMLLMPDRFVDGDSTNNCSSLTLESANKADIRGRWGGDLAGIEAQLDYITSLGATAVWPTPLLWDNEKAFSYHGYACADYYHIDPRFGTNEQYRQLVQKAHSKGLKWIMDIVTNHCGLAHWWMQDLPYADWVHQHATYTTTNNVFSSWYDPYASRFDRRGNCDGWFDTTMPDMNLDNPAVLHYFIQWAVWWIEWANLDGLRVDTYPYNEKEPMSRWCRAILTEYPWMNIVGECWTRPASAVAYWQANAQNRDGFNSYLPAVMDFPLEEAIRQALSEDGTAWGAGMARVYDALSQDNAYPNPTNLFLFIGNHDMEHIADVVRDHDYRRVMLAHTLVATMRGIPQFFAGDEYAQRSMDSTQGHSGLRRPLQSDDFLTEEQLLVRDYFARLYQWRRTEPLIWSGNTMHFMARDNTYAYFRYNDEGAVFVYVNASEQERVVPMANYAELTGHYARYGQWVINSADANLPDGLVDMSGATPLTVAPLSAIVVRLFNK